MPGEILQNINKNNDAEICEKEIRDFSRDENHITKIKDALQEQEKLELLSSLEDSLGKAIDTILGQLEISENDIKILDLWDKLLWEIDIWKKEDIKQKTNNLVQNISEISNRRIADRRALPISSLYSTKDIKTIQLWANICFGENIKITWERWIGINREWQSLWWMVYDISNQSPNDQLTNMYIFRQELITRGQVIDLRDTKFLLNMPNLNNLLSAIPDKSWQDKVFGEFLSFFLEIRRWWMYFENKIWNNNLQAILVGMINAEKYKNTSVDEYFADTQENLNKILTFKEDIKSLWHTTMYDYYESMYLKYKDTKIEDFIKWLEWYPEKKEELEKSFSWFTTAGEYYQSILTTVSEEPKKSMTIDEHFKEQEDMLKNLLKLKNGITVTTMGEYFKQIWDESMSQIRLIHKWNVDENTYLIIKFNLDSLNELIAISLDPNTDLSNANKQKAEELCKKLLELADTSNNSDLKTQILINISVLFTASEIEQKFWNDVSTQINNTRAEISRQVGEYEEINDILAQIENAEASEWSLSDLSRDELEEASPIAYNWLFNKKVYQSSLQDNTRVVNNNINSYSWSENQKTWYKLLSIPWCGQIVLKDVNEEQKIKDLISKANRWEISLVLSYYRISEFSFWTYFGQDLWEWDDNIVTIDDFSYSQKEPNWNILLYKIWSNTPYQTITLEQQQKAKQTNQLALMSTYTPENLAAYTEVSNIQKKMWDIQDLYNNMWTAKIDRKNVNYFWVLFSTINPLGSSMINSYVPVEWWLSQQDETSIFTQAEQIRDKLVELKTQEISLRQIRRQLFDMQKNIDKSRLTTEDETRLQQSLNAVDFLINGMQEWWSIDEFVKFMTNSKNVSTNGTFTELWAKRFRENWLKFALAIWCAVAVMAAPFSGWMSLMWVAALSTLAGMGWARLWQRANEWLQNRTNKTTVMVDWEERIIRFDDPTDIELLNQWKLPRWEFLTNIGMEFAIGTVSVYGFMKAGQIIWWSISKFADKCPNSKWARFLKTIKPKFKEINDPYTKNLFDNVAKWSQKIWFWKKFWTEFIEELWQETAEWTAEYISDHMWIPWLAMLVTTRNCLTPGANTQIYESNKVSFNGINRVWNNAELELHYDWDVNQLINHFKANWFEINTDWTLFKANEILPTITDVVRLVPSKVSVEARSMNNVLENFGIQINHETWDVTSSNPSKLVELQKYIELNNQWNMTINSDWTAVLSTPNETINIVPSDVSNVNPETNQASTALADWPILQEAGATASDVNQNGVVDWSDVDMMNQLDGKKTIEQLEIEYSKNIENLKNEINALDQTDPQYKNIKEQKDKRLESLKKWYETINQVKNKYQTKLDDINIQLENDPTNPDLLSQKEKYQKIQEMLNNWEVLSKRMSVIEIIKTRINILKFKLNKFVIQKTKTLSSTDSAEIQNKIDNINNQISKLQREVDTHEMNLQSLFAETYVWIRDLKWLSDVEMLEIGRVYNEHILKPIWFRTIDFSATFGDVLLDANGNTLGIWATNIEHTSEFSNSWINSQTFTDIKTNLYAIKEWANINEVDAIIQQEIEKIQNPAEKDMAQKLWFSIESKVNDGRLLASEKAIIFVHSLAFMSDYKMAFPQKTADEVFLLIEANQNKLIHQHVQDKSYLTWSSHDILHILRGNMDMAENFMKDMTPMERVLTRQIIIDHDMGYTSMFNKYLNAHVKNGNGKYFDATKDHPIWSTIFIEENATRYKENFWLEEYNIIKSGTLSHSAPNTTSLPNWEYNGITRPEVVYAVTSVVDCAAASADYKTAFLFGQPEIAMQFRLVYEAMAIRDFAAAEKNLVKIVEIINTSNIDPELRTSLLSAVDSMHLKPGPDGKIPFQEKLRSFENMTNAEIVKAKTDMIAKANKNNDPKNLEKVLDTFNKANSTNYDSITQLENATDAQVKNYVIFDYINGIVSFPYQKYLAQYGVRISIDKNTGSNLVWQENGVVFAQFELAWDTFTSLLEMWWAEFALTSFIKVCDDFNIKKSDPKMQELINNIKESQTTGDIIQELKRIYGADSITLIWKNGEKVTLNFEWKSYSDINNIVEAQTSLNESVIENTSNIKEAFARLDINQGVEQKEVIAETIKWYIDNIAAIVGNKAYIVQWITLAEYCDNLQKKVDKYIENSTDIGSEEIISDIDKISNLWFFPSLFVKTQN